jgi:hypothetical protein
LNFVFGCPSKARNREPWACRQGGEIWYLGGTFHIQF